MSQPNAPDATKPAEPPFLVKADEAAKMIGVGRTKVYEMMASGKLPIVRIGSAVRVNRQRLLEWIEKNTQQAA
jgi:excisionase family DNA binding protein